ncbi:hypothetical protein NQ317_006602 [Molorchus minor]|uniref:Protein sleepless n=1 Tax=Molorchus minor TaxID=1323400 RepID=A0ABQ9K1V4_9CUCU|nr:hypothetical protein NQ317_006602 [Molorchus minor]
MSSLVYYVVAFLFIVRTANGLNCYKCNSNEDASCLWGFVSFTYGSENCDNDGIVGNLLGHKCYKISAESKDGGQYVARGCVPNSLIGCNAIAKTIGYLASHTSNEGDSVRNIQCDTCDTDRCNSAQNVVGTTLFGLILAVAVFFI